MKRLKLNFFIFSIFVAFGNAFEIDDFSGDQSINFGESFDVYCHVSGGTFENKDWKHCIWTREADDEECTFTYYKNGDGDWQVDKSCSPGMADVSFMGDDPSSQNCLCGLNIDGADPQLHTGEWKCSIEQCQTGFPLGPDGCNQEDGVGTYTNATMNVEVITFT